jgi:hypothetical protein
MPRLVVREQLDAADRLAVGLEILRWQVQALHS